MTQGIEEQIRAVPAVEAEAHLVQVGLQVLGAELVPRSHDAALKQRECRFDAVRMDVSSKPDVFFPRVIHGFVSALEFTQSAGISGEFVGHNYIYIAADVLLDVPRKCSALGIFRMEEPQFTAALANSNYDFFVRGSPAASTVALFSAHISFVHFDSAIKHRAVNLSHS